MATFTLYGFLDDEALQHNKHIESNPDATPFGKLTGECANYFVNKSTINDIRKNRLEILETSRRPYGHMHLTFDIDRTNKEVINQISDIDCIRIFNIIERIYLSQGFTDNNIEYQLTNNVSYSNYIHNTFTHSNNETHVYIKDESGEEDKMVRTGIKDWYSFEYLVDTVDIKIHFWISKKAFTEEYPYTTITAVVPPFDPNDLINTSVMTSAGNFTMLTDASSFIFSETHKELFTRDQNGIYTYKTKYVIDASKSIQLPFAIAYCGPRVPSSLECRKHIRDYLENTVKINKDIIESLFPELYVGARFYIIPMWDKKTVRTDRDIYPSIHTLKEINEILAKIFSNEEEKFINTYTEIILNSQNKMWSITLPDQLNDNEIFSIYKQHPSYQDYSSQVPGFRYMDAATQEFSAKLNRCFAVLMGEIMSDEFIPTEINEMLYLSFMSGKAEYLVLTKDSYEKRFTNI